MIDFFKTVVAEVASMAVITVVTSCSRLSRVVVADGVIGLKVVPSAPTFVAVRWKPVEFSEYLMLTDSSGIALSV